MAYTLVPTELIVDGAITSAKLDTNIAISGTLGVTGEVTLATHLVMGDNDKIKIGTGGDLEIYHDGSNSYISNSTGNLYLGDTNGSVHIQAKLNEESIVCTADGAVSLYHDNAVKLSTTASGVAIGSTNNGVGGTIDLSVGSTSSTGGITLWSPTNGTHSLGFGDGYTGTDRYRGYVEYAHDGDSMRFATNATEAMRIDSSQNLLVGTTVSNPAGNNSVGVAISSGSYGGFIGVTRDGNTPVEINRKTSDGTLITFRKDSSAVGSIGTANSGDLYIGNDDTTLLFAGGSDAILPRGTAGAARDGAISLGLSSHRFNNLHLSGTAYVDTYVEIGNIQTTTNFPLIVKSGTNNHAIAIEEASGGETWQLGVDVDGDLGFYNSGGTTASVTFDDSGNVGIGTDSPNAAEFSATPNGVLEVEGTKPVVYLSETDTTDAHAWLGVSSGVTYLGSTGSGLQIRTGTDSASTKVTVDTSGNVGIGTSSPSKTLHVNGELQVENNLTLNENTPAIVIPNGDLRLFTGGTERMRIDSSGNVGIGTDSPDRNLHIETAGDSYLRVSGNRGNANDLHVGNIEFENSFGSAGVIAEIRAITGNSGTQSTKGQLAFYTDDGSTYAERMRIDSSGKVGIGTSSPAQLLEVSGNGGKSRFTRSGSAGTTMEFYAGGSQSGGIQVQSTGLGISGGTGENHVFIDTSGNLRVNTTAGVYSGGEKMSILASSSEGLGIKTTSATKQCLGLYNSDAGGARHFVRFALGASGNEVGNITSTGTTTAYNTSSDARLKDVTGEARGLEVINELNPVAYNWKESGQADEGLIAQEVKEIVPNAVSGSEEEMYQMDYSKLVVHLVKAIQEQQTIIDDLKTRIETLEG